MAAYLIHHAKGQAGDILIEDDGLDVAFHQGWVCFTDSAGMALALPAEQVSCIQRVDDSQASDSPTTEG